MIDKNIEEERGKETATRSYLSNLNPEIWSQISSMPIPEQDSLWFALTQKHLSVYEEAVNLGKVEEVFKSQGFLDDELRLLILNYFGALSFPRIDSELPQKGGIFLPNTKIEKINKFTDFIERVKGIIKENPQKFWVLVSGIGIVGKATTRTVLAKELIEGFPMVVVLSSDRDYEKLPLNQLSSPAASINIIEDVHGLDMEEGILDRFDGKEGLPKGYNLVVYVLPVPKTYKQSLLNRGESWVRHGKIDLTDPQRKQPENLEGMIEETAAELERTQQIGRGWYKEHLISLKELRRRGVPTIVIDPSPFFEVAYGFKGEEGILNTPFLELLQKRFDLSDKKMI